MPILGLLCLFSSTYWASSNCWGEELEGRGDRELLSLLQGYSPSLGFRAFSLVLWNCLLHAVGEVCVGSPIRKYRINFIEELGNWHKCGQCRSSKFQAMQPYVTGLIWHRMKSPLKALLVLTFRLVDFSLSMTPKGRNQFCQLYFCSHPSALLSAVIGGPTFSQGSRCCHVCLAFPPWHLVKTHLFILAWAL